MQGCTYVQPLLSVLRARKSDADVQSTDVVDIAVRGWLHDRPAVDLIGAYMSWLGSQPFSLPRLWWQTNTHCHEQLAACDVLRLVEVLRVNGERGTWETRA